MINPGSGSGIIRLRRKIPLLFKENNSKTVCRIHVLKKQALKRTRSVCLRNSLTRPAAAGSASLFTARDFCGLDLEGCGPSQPLKPRRASLHPKCDLEATQNPVQSFLNPTLLRSRLLSSSIARKSRLGGSDFRANSLQSCGRCVSKSVFIATNSHDFSNHFNREVRNGRFPHWVAAQER